MPVPVIATALTEGLDSIPHVDAFAKATLCLSTLYVLKRYFNGAACPAHVAAKPMASKVVLVTGGTSGVGAEVVRGLAKRGAQVIVLTQHEPSDPFLVDYIDDVRRETGNQLVYAEQCDLASLWSVRKFATRWIDNKPVRRLDMVVLCANVVHPGNGEGGGRYRSGRGRQGRPKWTVDGLDEEWQVNYLANYHLLSILSPALRAQPPDRDVRIVFATCSSYIGATIDFKTLDKRTMPLKKGREPSATQTSAPPPPTTTTTATSKSKSKAKKPASTFQPYTPTPRISSMYSTTKLATMIFAHAFHQHLEAFDRPDKHVNNAQVLLADPGFTRTPGMRRYLTGGSLWMLLCYLITWPLWWLVLKDPNQGAQTILAACMDEMYSAETIHAAAAAEKLGVPRAGKTEDGSGDTAGAADSPIIRAGQGVGGLKVIKECRERDIARREVGDAEVSRQLWEYSQRQIEEKEKEAAILRALEKRERELREAEQQKTAATADGGGNGAKERTSGSRRSRKG
ncbi:hypothetical protein KEM52_000370 [Ascosphaera acerosa]|nr:hypothetical protein KEM52_000370 [Ascosphaera acerosa]